MTPEFTRMYYGDPARVYERIEAQEQYQADKRSGKRIFKEDAMTQDQAEQIEDLLMGWYYWARASREFLGHSKTSPMFRGTKAELGDVHATVDDVDARINAYNSEIIDACLGELPVPMRAAVGVHTRNKAVGTSVHRHPRVAIEQQHAIYLSAKERLCPVLMRKGIVNRA